MFSKRIKSYSKIMAGFIKTITALDDLAKYETANVKVINKEMDTLEVKKGIANQEISSAKTTASKLRELLGR